MFIKCDFCTKWLAGTNLWAICTNTTIINLYVQDILNVCKAVNAFVTSHALIKLAISAAIFNSQPESILSQIDDTPRLLGGHIVSFFLIFKITLLAKSYNKCCTIKYE